MANLTAKTTYTIHACACNKYFHQHCNKYFHQYATFEYSNNNFRAESGVAEVFEDKEEALDILDGFSQKDADEYSAYTNVQFYVIERNDLFNEECENINIAQVDFEVIKN